MARGPIMFFSHAGSVGLFGGKADEKIVKA